GLDWRTCLPWRVRPGAFCPSTGDSFPASCQHTPGTSLSLDVSDRCAKSADSLAVTRRWNNRIRKTKWSAWPEDPIRWQRAWDGRCILASLPLADAHTRPPELPAVQPSSGLRRE